MISSYNEWDPLKRVVLGTAEHANWPTTDPVFIEEGKKSLWTETPVPAGPVPQQIINETQEDLSTLAKTFHQLGIEVDRPTELNFQTHDGLYNYCPRDRFIVYGGTMVDCAMMYPCRDMEYQCYIDILQDAKTILRMPRDKGLVLDAANIMRLNNTWLFLESASGNKAAHEWLCDHFPDVNIELCNFYSGVHIDSTITPLREGLVLLNGSRVNESNCPKALEKWDKIYVEDVVPQDFYRYPYASKWIALNMLVIDPHTVMVDKHQTELIKKLEQWSFTVIPLELRHSRTLGGAFHCVTLDLVRSK